MTYRSDDDPYSLSLYACTGKGYENGWWTNFRGRYRVYKGARNTKKSYVMIGLEVLDKIISDPYRNVVIVRAANTSHRYSTFATIKMLIAQPNPKKPWITLSEWFDVNETTMTIIYRPTGQRILFFGSKNPERITSLRVPVGFVTDVYIEEAFEITDYETFRKLDGTIRGRLPKGCFHQITLCFNAWRRQHWLYDIFFKDRLEDDFDYLSTHPYMDYKDSLETINGGYGRGVYLHISTFRINEFRDKEIYDPAMEEMSVKAPNIFRVEGLGMWGVAGNAAYSEFTDNLVIPRQKAITMRYDAFAIGIDTGLSDGQGRYRTSDVRSATTMQLVGVTNDWSTLVCVDEFFHSNEAGRVRTEPQLMNDLIDTIARWKMKYSQSTIMRGMIPMYVDSADLGFRQGLEVVAREKNVNNLRISPSTKIPIRARVDFTNLMMAYGDYLISDACPNLIREMRSSLTGDNGKARADGNDHAINANEYAWAPFTSRLVRWKSFKPHT